MRRDHAPRWTDPEIARLLELEAAGTERRIIARKLGRSLMAVIAKLDRLRDEGIGLPARRANGLTDDTWITRRNLARGG